MNVCVLPCRAIFYFAFKAMFYSRKNISIRERFLVENKIQLHFSGAGVGAKVKM